MSGEREAPGTVPRPASEGVCGISAGPDGGIWGGAVSRPSFIPGQTRLAERHCWHVAGAAERSALEVDQS
jgi:hypothetical protein